MLEIWIVILGRCDGNLTCAISVDMFRIKIIGILCEIAIRLMPENPLW